jgi:hypothetical protein
MEVGVCMEEAAPLMKARKQRQRTRPGHTSTLTYLLPPTRPCLLKAATPPNSATRWGPSLQHMSIWEHISSIIVTSCYYARVEAGG